MVFPMGQMLRLVEGALSPPVLGCGAYSVSVSLMFKNLIVSTFVFTVADLWKCPQTCSGAVILSLRSSTIAASSQRSACSFSSFYSQSPRSYNLSEMYLFPGPVCVMRTSTSSG